jgi:hypothetical protein
VGRCDFDILKRLLNPPPANGGGLFVSRHWFAASAPNHMNPTQPVPRTRRDRPAPTIDPVEDSVFLLGLLYVELGLAPEAAFRSALADYECAFERSDVCRL